MMDNYSVIAEQDNCTVVGRYESKPRQQTVYQSEAALEERLLKQLSQQGYELLSITTEEALLDNLRRQLEALNDIELSESEWKRLREMVCSDMMGIEEKTQMIQTGEKFLLPLDNGENKNIMLIDRNNIHHNQRLQVLHQYTPEGGAHENRYDVTILVNGLPLVHIELKRRGEDIKEAFNQINRYQRDSFWAGAGLYDYAQIFVISNGTETKYYSNTTRYAHVMEAQKQRSAKEKRESNSFEFTSYWSDAENTCIFDLEDFAATFLQRRTLLNVLTRYCVFTVDKNLMVMRPYQIAATEAILRRINQALLNKQWLGTTKAGGYIWHTTGSGKTLTSFKTAQLASQDERVKKVLFIVDRKDLDYQTMKEYDNFQKDCANSNSSSLVLKRQLKDPDARIIITTIQKLSNLLKPASLGGDAELQQLMREPIVLIFDECHRSQFGDMQKLVRKAFKRYMMFGFTGTPIFPQNAGTQGDPDMRTTAQVFGGELDQNGNYTAPLHSYTIINAIRDKNVLKFKVDYERTMRMRSDADTKQVWGIDKEEALHSPERVRIIVQYILDQFDKKTKQGDIYGMSHTLNIKEMAGKGFGKVKAQKTKKLATKGFNSILAVDSVQMAIAYYDEFQRQMKDLPPSQQRTIATIFSYSANEAEDETGTLEDENPEGVGSLDSTSRDSLERAIKDYNEMFGTSYSTDGDKFQSYYKDVSLRMKDKQIDILIVVGMFLTGFDAKTLNTLWVDKNLKMHGLLQAYSRTNRILNAVKDCGNIVCFRNLEEQTNESLALFGDTDPKGIILMRTFEDYYYGYDALKKNGKMEHLPGYKELISQLLEQFPLERMPLLQGEKEKHDFILLMGNVLRMQNLLSSFDDFTLEKQIVPPLDMQDYLGWYRKHYEDYRKERAANSKERESIKDDIVFEMELVKQVAVGIDFILALIVEYKKKNGMDYEIRARIQKALDSDPDMHDKRELVERFIDSQVPDGEDIQEKFYEYVEEQSREELDAIIAEEDLKGNEAREFMRQSFEEGYVNGNGTAITRILPPMPIFGGGAKKRADKKKTVLEKLQGYFKKFYELLYRVRMERAESPIITAKKLSDVEDDQEVRNLIYNRLQLDNTTSDMQLQREVMEVFGERYPDMMPNDWRHIIEDYTPMVREASKAKEIPLDLSMAADEREDR